MVIYTVGYTGSSYDDLRRFIAATHSILVDIRFSPRSRVPMWELGAVADAVGRENYVHCKALGNRNYKGDGIVELDNPQLGVAVIEGLFAKGRNVILMCACKDPYGCHRWDAAQEVARALITLSPQIVHLPARFSQWKPAA